MSKRLPDATDLDEGDLLKLYNNYGPDQFNLHDRGYIARRASAGAVAGDYLQTHPNASRSEMMAASTEQRQEVYAWLLKSKRKGAADTRIRIILEEDAFERVARGLGPGRLSLRQPGAVLRDRDRQLRRPAGGAGRTGRHHPQRRRAPADGAHRVGSISPKAPLTRRFCPSRRGGERLFPTEVAAALRRALTDVVANGTAKRVAGAFVDAVRRGRCRSAARPAPVTNFGRQSALARARRRRSAQRRLRLFHWRPLLRCGDRPRSRRTARHYKFTSALPVQVLKVAGAGTGSR